MIQLDSILGPFIIGANAELKDLDLRIKEFELFEQDERFAFYIHDYIDGSEVPMVVPFHEITNWMNAQTPRAQKYLMECIIKEILFDYEDTRHDLMFDEHDRLIFYCEGESYLIP